jgi:L,D-transpeptidase catalytic domain
MQMRAFLTTLGCIGFMAAPSLARQPSADESVAYTTERSSILYMDSDSTRPYLHLRFREPLIVREEVGRFARVRTMDGAHGLIEKERISNVWIRISKKSQTVFVYRGATLVERLPADLGYNFFSDKQKRGSSADPDHWRTPEGEFFIVSKNSASAYYKALVLNYPNAEDAERGLRDGLISEDEFEQIVEAENRFTIPPMGTDLGGFIEIHGEGTGRRSNWTQGCIAVQNEQIDRLWSMVQVGTPVLIER